MSKGGSGSSMTQGGGQSSFGGQMPMQQQGYQSTFGNQNYRSQPSQPTFNNYSYQQPGQFGGQMMNQPMRSPGGKGGYSAPMVQQPMRSPGLKGGQPRSPVQIQPYPMPSPGGKGRSYQPPSTPYGYGQSTFNPGQFGGYGQPSNMFSFSSPHYQPYVPQQYETQPYRGNDPRTPTLTNHELIVDSFVTPKVSGTTGYPPGFNPGTGFFDYFRSSPSKGGTYQPQPINQPTGQPLPVIPSMPQTKIIDPRGAFTPPTQPPAPINNQTLTPVMPKPTMPSREVPEFASVGGIGGGQPFGIGSLIVPSGLPGRSESFTPPIQNETAAKNFWSQAQKAMDSGSLADADRFLRQYESITGTRNPMYGLSALDPSGYQSAIANR